ncbi:unnamed protein product [Amoebophrya sp. A25]|nr:unnamed protein product [Amoebophrya sp. A25]|eukprot:GSA25T00014577001.1
MLWVTLLEQACFRFGGMRCGRCVGGMVGRVYTAQGCSCGSLVVPLDEVDVGESSLSRIMVVPSTFLFRVCWTCLWCQVINSGEIVFEVGRYFICNVTLKFSLTAKAVVAAEVVL